MIKKIFKENYIYLIIILLLVTIFSIVMRSSLHDKIILFDKKIINLVNRNVSSSVVNIFKVLTRFGGFVIPCIILIILLIFHKNKWIFILQSCSYAIAGIITYLSKLLAARPRPEIAIIKIPKSFSFPSGHTLTSIVFYTMLCYLLTYNMKNRKVIMIIGFIFALLIASSRVYLGVHYFSDIVGGFIIAIPCLLMCINIIRKNYKDKLVLKK